MPDITMCLDYMCPLANSCRRSEFSGTKPGSDRQPYFMTSPRGESQRGKLCDYYSKVVSDDSEAHDGP
jgi:hypothetical protein